jgi:hypothetical protein
LVPIQLRNNYSCSGNMNKILKLNYTVTILSLLLPK